ncbi:MAG TPA: glycine--tRNA ligase [Clostridia bacterium]|jgi:glycyl-tRNA synthetase|nr:MAG: Glycine--tRNA ligase [Firmicutes bacterium ADurb.Bin146]HOD93954.1 glycine--tRNA ligase [Clostridia bacterium]HQM40062.1 glycine--tRNA ligase [Clostridia bacterium]
MNRDQVTMDKLVSLAKRRGFVYPGSEIYDGLANAWDYGPLGVELKNNIKSAWWQKFIKDNEYNVGIDCAILMNPNVWVASGHVGSFVDPLTDCKNCKTRHRADDLIRNFNESNNINMIIEGFDNAALMAYIKEKQIPCPNCGKHDFTDVKQFNCMFKTYQGVNEDTAAQIYLRPETAQGIFVNFKNVQRTTRKKIPFGIGQIGKSFRNEITPGNFIFRTREFEQMELEFFCEPGTDIKWFEYWRNFCYNWLLSIGIKKDNIRMRDHSEKELSFYSNATTDFEFMFPFGWGELWGIADRTDYDLKQHAKFSNEDLTYFDPMTNEKYVPYCIEPSVGVERLLLALLTDAYDEEQLQDDDLRTVLRFHPYIAPVKAAVLPLSKKLGEDALKVFEMIRKKWNAEYDDTQSIGKRYRRQDEIGTPFCFTYDFDSISDNCVTVRYRDSMKQDRISINSIMAFLDENIKI